MQKLVLSIVAAALCVSGAQAAGSPRQDPAGMAYPYGETGTFGSFVQDSFRVVGARDPRPAARSFFTYMGTAIPAQMDAVKPKLARLTDPKARTAAEMALCADLHHAIKKQIPRFSLDRGFEFYQTVKRGERQCFLQSVVVSGLLQRAGVPSGVVMVDANEKGVHSNNGHAVVVARLADGNDILVDCSDPKPFMTHQGLMVSLPAAQGYAYVTPLYDAAHKIVAYRNLRDGGKSIRPAAVATLDVPFLRSQFDYYRGERTPGGLFTPPLGTPAGIAKSAAWLQKSVQECPRNPLAVYMLGKMNERLGKNSTAQDNYLAAYALYTRYGWVPREEARVVAAIKARRQTPRKTASRGGA